MKFTVKNNSDEIISKTKVRSSIFMRQMCDTVVDLSTPKTPKDKGNLRQDIIKRVVGTKGQIEWGKNYAQYQERGKRADGTRQIKNYTTPGTGPHFAENAIKEAVKKTGVVARLAHLI